MFPDDLLQSPSKPKPLMKNKEIPSSNEVDICISIHWRDEPSIQITGCPLATFIS